MLRVDSNRAMTSDSEGCFSGAAARTIGQQLNGGSVLRVEAVEWPYDYAVQKETPIAGAFNLTKRVFQFSQSADPSLFR